MSLNRKILLVDDEEGFLSVIKEALEIRGFDIVTAKSAIEAGLELSSKKPDLILMDIKMPGIDGLQACAAIKKNPDTNNIPIMVVSAISEEAQVKRAYKMGISDYFVKPVDIEKLVNRIKETLGIQ
ncbi:MAG: response regulator [Candidatus Omnitrophica bacterium]|nr:response regulator [Candidatus Omnitrophota bacterium]